MLNKVKIIALISFAAGWYFSNHKRYKIVKRGKIDSTTRKNHKIDSKLLIAGMFHDIRTPLTSIKAYSEGLLDDIAITPEMQSRYLNIIHDRAKYMDKLLDKLFIAVKTDVNKLPSDLEKLDIGYELSNFFRVFSSEFSDRGINLEIPTTNRGIFVNADKVLLYEVFSNIVENSIRYRANDEVNVQVLFEKAGSKIVITIKDNGNGVNEAELEQIFQPFYRARANEENEIKGSGLGLAVCRMFVEEFDGRIYARNFEDGFGILIELPIVNY